VRWAAALRLRPLLRLLGRPRLRPLRRRPPLSDARLLGRPGAGCARPPPPRPLRARRPSRSPDAAALYVGGPRRRRAPPGGGSGRWLAQRSDPALTPPPFRPIRARTRPPCAPTPCWPPLCPCPADTPRLHFPARPPRPRGPLAGVWRGRWALSRSPARALRCCRVLGGAPTRVAPTCWSPGLLQTPRCPAESPYARRPRRPGWLRGPVLALSCRTGHARRRPGRSTGRCGSVGLAHRSVRTVALTHGPPRWGKPGERYPPRGRKGERRLAAGPGRAAPGRCLRRLAGG